MDLRAVLIGCTAPSRDLDLRQQLPSLDETFAEPKYRTPSPANFLGELRLLFPRWRHDRMAGQNQAYSLMRHGPSN